MPSMTMYDQVNDYLIPSVGYHIEGTDKIQTYGHTTQRFRAGDVCTAEMMWY
jgi:hypothetical protein